MSDLTFWDDPLYNIWLGPELSYHGLAIDDAYRLNSWTLWNRSQRG
jgi:hypothetical protein